MTGTVLILGNGISRLAFEKEIKEFRGEVWGCNRIYLDYGDKITALAGHADVMQEALVARDASVHKYDIFGIDVEFFCQPIFQKDTGTTLVAEALTQKKKVICCGFDMGVLDVYSPGHEKKNKSTWIQRWRLILAEFGSENVSFWGYDHKPFLLGRQAAGTYSEKYTRGKNHIETDEYQKQAKEWKNDYSRIYSMIPCSMLRNRGQREITVPEAGQTVGSGESVLIPTTCAQKYVSLYPADFELLPD